MRQGLRPARSTRSRVALGAPALVLVLAVGGLGTLSACTGGASDTATNGGKSAQLPDRSTVSPVPPGKYKTLPQPCVAVDLDTLKALVPGAPDYSGRESLTYDTGRRVGCGWQAKTPDGSSRTLTIDMERVVSYDPAVSDEVEAKSDFDDLAVAASIPAAPLPGTTPTTPATPTNSTGSASPTGSPGGSQDLSPRRLPDVGNAAFINDVASTRKGTARRDVTLVFRTANVVVSIHYAQSSPADGTPPQSADLQGGAETVAAQLERRVER
ncbi:hypothetical protein [Actinacidiphila paucisporea]|uniref:DUF3558 domain-containing protein n=1 Tax=Actinacidiphila paucisporea TaxID=310782 RepID=A0A1M7PWM9_9ACTN|nr:hypothetical protein [Actinacidiphila paucisporea]SHN21944.1 hypothetical protein SAMN05216499_12682 [Actinacidiphila paucisporea]